MSCQNAVTKADNPSQSRLKLNAAIAADAKDNNSSSSSSHSSSSEKKRNLVAADFLAFDISAAAPLNLNFNSWTTAATAATAADNTTIHSNSSNSSNCINPGNNTTATVVHFANNNRNIIKNNPISTTFRLQNSAKPARYCSSQQQPAANAYGSQRASHQPPSTSGDYRNSGSSSSSSCEQQQQPTTSDRPTGVERSGSPLMEKLQQFMESEKLKQRKLHDEGQRVDDDGGGDAHDDGDVRASTSTTTPAAAAATASTANRAGGAEENEPAEMPPSTSALADANQRSSPDDQQPQQAAASASPAAGGGGAQRSVMVPFMLQSDAKFSSLKSTRLLDALISCFVVGGECRLCMPQLVALLLSDVATRHVDDVCVRLGITNMQANREQIQILKAAGALPPSAANCQLITKSNAERLVAQFTTNGRAPLADTARERMEYIQVAHDCFGGCVGRLYGSLAPGACIECTVCRLLFQPEDFCRHTHPPTTAAVVAAPNATVAAAAAPDRKCHWGFDASNWAFYLHVDDDWQWAGASAAADSAPRPTRSSREVEEELIQFVHNYRNLQQRNAAQNFLPILTEAM